MYKNLEEFKKANQDRLIKLQDQLKLRFYQLPKLFFINGKVVDYKNDLSLGAKVLYSILRDRWELSKKNGWIDEDGTIFFRYSIKDLAEILAIGKNTVRNHKKELKEVGLLFEDDINSYKTNKFYLLEPVADPEDYYQMEKLEEYDPNEHEGEPENCKKDTPSNNENDNNYKAQPKRNVGGSKNRYPLGVQKSIPPQGSENWTQSDTNPCSETENKNYPCNKGTTRVSFQQKQKTQEKPKNMDRNKYYPLKYPDICEVFQKYEECIDPTVTYSDKLGEAIDHKIQVHTKERVLKAIELYGKLLNKPNEEYWISKKANIRYFFEGKGDINIFFFLNEQDAKDKFYNKFGKTDNNENTYNRNNNVDKPNKTVPIESVPSVSESENEIKSIDETLTDEARSALATIEKNTGRSLSHDEFSFYSCSLTFYSREENKELRKRFIEKYKEDPIAYYIKHYTNKLLEKSTANNKR